MLRGARRTPARWVISTTEESRFLEASGGESLDGGRRSQSKHYPEMQDYLELRSNKGFHLAVSLALKEHAMLVPPAPHRKR